VLQKTDALILVKDMARFRAECGREGLLRCLTSITLTTPQDVEGQLDAWLVDVRELLRSSPLVHIHIYASDDTHGHIPDWFVGAVVEDHRTRLTRFSVHRVGLSLNAIALLCRQCVYLEQLFVVLESSELV
jgi:hypothetical protein